MLPNRPSDVEPTRQKTSAKVDYKGVLSPEEFARFTSFRRIRKQIADSEAIPAYAVFTDAELAELSKLSELSLETMRKVPGIGKKKLEKYASAFVADTEATADEADRVLDGEDSRP